MSGSSERNEERVVTVSISNVSVRDAGVYWCGAETRDTYLTFISLNTKIQIINTVYSQSFVLNVCIICSYDSIYKSKPKSLCKGKCSTRDRNPLSETVREEKETKTGRLTLNDDVTAGVFTGTITGLTAEDAGKYWCTIRDDRFSFSDEASTGVFTVNITDLREEDSGIYWCGAHITTKVSLTVKMGKLLIFLKIYTLRFTNKIGFYDFVHQNTTGFKSN
uniref:Immunoglobulin V-set domain-containing protein n=1 Tax=Cyprinus carpio TaxID=7962 RepID=A0A8C1LFQ9_CYPCA